MKRLILTMIFMILPQLSQAGFYGQDKGGGMVLNYKGQYQLLDFAENGLEQSATLSTTQADRWQVRRRLEVSLNNDPVVATAAANKLYEVASKNLHMGRALYKNFFEIYSWRIVSWDLVQTRDVGTSPIISEGVLYQAAVRDDAQKVIWINKQIWGKLSLSHKVGLIYHEAFYALTSLALEQYTSVLARNLTAHVFSPSFAFEKPEVFHTMFSREPYFDRGLFFGDALIPAERGSTIFQGGPLLDNATARDLDIEHDMAAFTQKAKVLVNAWRKYFWDVSNPRETDKISEIQNGVCDGRTVHRRNTTVGLIPTGPIEWDCTTKGLFGRQKNRSGSFSVFSKEEIVVVNSYNESAAQMCKIVERFKRPADGFDFNFREATEELGILISRCHEAIYFTP